MRKNKNTAAFLALFGGIFGVHKFYLGEAPVGVFYIFLYIISSVRFPISLLLGVIDAIRLFSMSVEEFDRKYNKGQSSRKTKSRYQTKRRGETTRAKTNKELRKSRKPKSNPFKRSGIKKYKEYEMEEAVDDLNKALLVDDSDSEIYFTLACAHSLMENVDKAYKNLELAVMNGFKEFDRISSEDNLAFLRIDDNFEKFKSNQYRISSAPRLKSNTTDNLLNDDVLLSQLNKLAELRKKGLLSEIEFEYERKKLLRK